MIVDEQPVANIEPPPVDQHGFAYEPLDDRQRDELFWELMRPVVIRAIGEQNREPVGMAPCSDQMVRRRLAGRIGGARIVPGLLGKSSVFLQRAINLVRGDMKESEVWRARVEQAPMH